MPPRKTAAAAANKKTTESAPVVTATPTPTPSAMAMHVAMPVTATPTPAAMPVTATPTPAAMAISTKVKKAKKQVQVVALVTPDGIEGSFQPTEQRRSLIAHLQIHSNEINFNDSTFQFEQNLEKQPEPYDGVGDQFAPNHAPFEQETQEQHDEINRDFGKPVPIADPLGNPQTSVKAETGESAPLQPFYRCNLMVCYRDTNETHALPNSVDVACFWCTEPFEGQPCVVPEREEKGTYKIYGNFCCPECGLAFLLNESLDPHVRWERIALLHRLYTKWYTSRIFPAPKRESLKKFGGPMAIEQYRKTIRGNGVRVDIQMPPLVSILGTMDTKPIDFYDTSVRNSANGVVTERINRAEEGLRLRRNKPLKDKESTLDACMKINIR